MSNHFEKYTFPNKVRLITVPSEDTQAVTILFLFGVGSRFEDEKNNGVSHFIEHLMFKGTEKRPNTLAISKELDRVGAEFNAMTSKDYTGYYIKISADKAELAIEILSDMLISSKFAPVEMNRERGVIVEEINMYNDNPLMKIESVFEEVVYDGHSLGLDIAGPAEVIRSIKRADLLAYKNKFYTADNVVIAMAGKITSDLKTSLKKKFVDKLPRAEVQLARQALLAPFVITQNKPQVKLVYKDTKQAQIAIGFPSFGYGDKRAFTLHLLSIILGGNMSSRLFISVRERLGLAYFVRCYPNYYQGAGNIMIQSGLDGANYDKAVGVIMRELDRIKKSGVTQKELHDAREFLRGKVVLTLEDSSSLAEFYAKQEILTDKIVTPAEKMKLYEKVTRAQIQELAREIFVSEHLNLAVIGAFTDAEKLLKSVL